MRIIKDQTKNHVRKVTVQLQMGEVLVALTPNAYYQLNRLGDIVQADALMDATQVDWCDISQTWVPYHSLKTTVRK